jgi:hypothetical protein
MSAYKQFTTQDVVITPFDATKTFSYSGDEIISSNSGIEFYLGKKPLSNDFVSSPQISTGITYKENTTGVYNSIKQLYYTNYLSSSLGDNVPLPVLVPGVSSEFDETVGATNAPRFENYLQSTLTQSRYFPTQSEAEISVISIPSKLFGENIVPSTFNFKYYVSSSNEIGWYVVTDDGEGNLNSNFSGSEIFNITSEKLTRGVDGVIGTFPFLFGSFPTSSNNFIELNSTNGAISIPFNAISNTASVTFNFSGSNFRNIFGQISTSPFSQVQFYLSSSYGISPTASMTYDNIGSFTTTLYAGVEYFLFNKPNTWSPPNNTFFYDIQISAVSSPINYIEATSSIVGQIFYSHGIATLTTGGLENMATSMSYYYLTGSGYGVGDYGQNIYGVAPTRIYPYLFPSAISFMSSYRIYENQYKCTVRENEFNYTQNPSARSGSGEFYYSFVTGSSFSPYVTTMGLYNDAKELLVVGKLSQPIPISLYTDTTFIVNFDI